MKYQTIITQQADEALVITLNRPDKRNAFSIQMMDEIVAALTAAEAEATVRAVIVTGGAVVFRRRRRSE